MNRIQARYCGNCGGVLPGVTCAVCGHDNLAENRFCTECGKALPKQKLNCDEIQITAAQNRLLTVLFIDLTDSTSLTETLDPEWVRLLVRRFQQVCGGIVRRYGGRVTEYLGDGIVAHFTGHENSAERGVKSALEIAGKVSEITVKDQRHLAVRSGVASGMAIVGDRVGEGEQSIESSIGIPLNLAKRIQGIARPGEVVIARETHELVRGLFRCEDLGWHALKGFSSAHRVWRVIGEAHVDSRFDAAHAKVAQMVDREEVMEVLMRRWQSVRAGKGQMVLISGEAGIGKSRIIQALDERLLDSEHYVLRYQCSPYHANTALYPVIAHISRAAGFEPGDDAAAGAVKLEQYLTRSRDDIERTLPLYCLLLSLPVPERYANLELEPAELKRRTLQSLNERVVALAQQSPVLVQLEDLHWIDPTSMEMLSLLVDSLHDKRIMLLVSTRPGTPLPLSNLPHVTTLTINRLPHSFTRELIQQIWSTSELPDHLLQTIVDRSEGIPLFAEELSKSLMERMAKDHDTGVSKESIPIPVTLQDSLLARLDHLSKPARAAAEVAAVIGREFSIELLAAVIGIYPNMLQERLQQLISAEVVTRSRASSPDILQFTHALMCDAAYTSLLRDDRERVHARIAEVLQRQFPALVKASPEISAHHWSEAGDFAKSIPLWLLAGQRASERFANIEAANHLERGLKLVDKLPPGGGRDQQELSLRVAITPVLRVSEGAGAERTRANCDRAVALCNLLPVSHEQFAALWGKWQNAMSFKMELGLEWTDRLDALADTLGDTGLKLQVHHCKWTTLFHIGRFTEVMAHVEAGLGLYDKQLHRRHAFIYGGHDPRICAATFAAHTLWMLGYPDQALEYAQRCTHWGRGLNHVGSLLHVVELHLLQYQYRREPENLDPWLQQLQRICSDNRLQEYEGKYLYCNGWLLANRGEVEQGLVLMRQGMEIQHSVGSLEDIGLFSDQLAGILATSGALDEAMAIIEQALLIAETYSLCYWQAGIERRKGELFRLLGDVDHSRVWFDQALRTAEQQNAKALQLRVAMSLARWHQEQGDSAAGRALLQPLVSTFSEGFDTPDLIQAAQLLGELSRSADRRA